MKWASDFVPLIYRFWNVSNHSAEEAHMFPEISKTKSTAFAEQLRWMLAIVSIQSSSLGRLATLDSYYSDLDTNGGRPDDKKIIWILDTNLDTKSIFF